MAEITPTGQKKPNLLFLAGIGGAFLTGAIGGAALMSHRAGAPSPPAEGSKGSPGEKGDEKPKDATEEGNKESPSGEGSGGKAGLIKLSAKAMENAGIRTEPAKVALFREALTVPGTVEVASGRSAKVTPPVTGKVVRLSKNIGDIVRAGEALLVLDSAEVAQANAAVRDSQAQVSGARAGEATAEARVTQAVSRAESAQAALTRQRELARTGAFSQPSLQAARNDVADAQAELSGAETALSAASTVRRRNEALFKEELTSRSDLEQSQTEERQTTTRLERARKRFETAQEALRREEKIFRGGLLSKQAVQTAEAEVRAARAEVAQARKEREAAQTALEGTRTRLTASRESLRALLGEASPEKSTGRVTVPAPIGGVVTSRPVTLGEAVERTSELFMIQNLGTVLVVAQVPEAKVAQVKVGQRVEITAASYPERRFSGVIQTIGSEVDPKTRTLPVRCLVGNESERLKPEMFAEVRLPVSGGHGRREALTVPTEAIASDGEERFVFVREQGGYERRSVKVGRTSGERTEILSGLKAGAPVAAHGVFVLKSESMKDELKGD